MRSYLFAAVLTVSVSAFAQQPAKTDATPWWKHAVIYEIYPRSFQDSNGDGVGDLNGITSRLDYLQKMGVDAIWLTPIYPSPQIDFGYDVSDYTAIDPTYGTMADFDRLMREAGKRHIRVLMDLVLNHTSDKHPWFVESASSRTNPKRDWYIWRDGKTGADGKPLPPNNWVNRIQQTAWRYDPKTSQFNYHYYATEQPDLNWRNPAVEKAMFDVARFWLDKGVAGFRLDAINTLFEDELLRDEPALPGTNEYGEPSLSQVRQRNQPEVHDVLRGLRRVSDSYAGDRLLVGEIYTKSTAELAPWYGTNDDELHLPMNTNVGFTDKLNAAKFRKLLMESETKLRGNTPLFVLDNHDRARSWDRYGDGVHNAAIAKLLATILLTTRATALVYQGQELGMETMTPTRLEDVRDPRALAGWPKEKGRDGERTPMQWSMAKNAGFSTAAKTWLPVEPDYEGKNVAAESRSEASLLNWYRGLISLKKNNVAVHQGATTFWNYDTDNALVWVRSGTVPVMVACNFSAKPVTLRADVLEGKKLYTLMDSDFRELKVLDGAITLAPFQTLIGELKSGK